MKVVVFHSNTQIENLYTLIPFVHCIDKQKDLNITLCSENNLGIQSGDILVITRRYEKLNLDLEKVENEITNYKKRFERIIYFDDSAALSKINWRIVELVDSYWKRGLLRDRSLYSRQMYGGRLYSDYYNKKYNISDNKIDFNQPLKKEDQYLWEKIKVAWNIGIGLYPYGNSLSGQLSHSVYKKVAGRASPASGTLINRLICGKYINNTLEVLTNNDCVNLKSKNTLGRMSIDGYTETVGHQRRLMKKLLDERGIKTTKVNNTQYYRELNECSSVISPFGWGEICFRDFEAALYGKVLLKPDCSHIETWPNIYEKNQYISINWDLNNINEALELGENKELRENYVYEARERLKDAYKSLTSRVRTLLNDEK